MDISKTIQEMKQNPAFRDNVGMILIHNGVVRSWSRKDKANVVALEVTPNQEKYPNQKIFVISALGYTYLVPYVKNGDEIFLKTIIPSRKAQKIYKGDSDV